MDSTRWYAVALGVIAASVFVSCLLWRSIVFTCSCSSYYFLKYLSYPQIPHIFKGKSQTTRFELFLILMVLMGNVLCCTIGIQDVPAFTRRLGVLSIVNNIPLAMGGHPNLVMDFCGIGVKSYALLHQWMGRTTIVEGLLHSALMLSVGVKSNPRMLTRYTGMIVSAIPTANGVLSANLEGCRGNGYYPLNLTGLRPPSLL